VAVGAAGAAAGVLAGAGLSWATAYGSSLACGPAAGVCAGAVTVALVGYGGYKLYNGGWKQLKGSFGRVFSSQTASVGDALTVGATLGGVAYGAGTSFGRGAALQRAVVENGARTGLAHREAIREVLVGSAQAPPGTTVLAPRGEALKNVLVDEEAAGGLQSYKNLTAKDFSSASDPRLEQIRRIADRDNREVAEALRVALAKRGIENVEIQQRTKSAASILGKLQETPGQTIGGVKDLSGIRINIKNVNQPGFKQHDEIMAAIKEVIQTNKIKDYNQTPNEWGYTGRVHAFTESQRGVSSEIQVGSRELSQFIEAKFMTNSGKLVEVHDLTGYKGYLYGKPLPQDLQTRYTQLIGEIGRANGAGKNAAEVPELKAGIQAFQRDVQAFLNGLGASP